MLLGEIALQMPQATLGEVAAAMQCRDAVRVCDSPIRQKPAFTGHRTVDTQAPRLRSASVWRNKSQALRLQPMRVIEGCLAHAIEQTQWHWCRSLRRPGSQSNSTLHDSQQSMRSPLTAGFIVQPKRWVVGLTHAWAERWRRMVMHHDAQTSVSTAWVGLAEARCLLNRLASSR